MMNLAETSWRRGLDAAARACGRVGFVFNARPRACVRSRIFRVTFGPVVSCLMMGVLLGVCLVAPGVRGADPVAADAWPVYRGNALSTGVAPCVLPEKLELQWQFAVKGGSFESTPAIMENRVFIADLDGAIYGLDLRTGKQVWRHPTDSSFLAPAACRDGRVYVGDMDGTFYCLDAGKGNVLGRMRRMVKLTAVPGSTSNTFCSRRKTVGSIASARRTAS